MGFHRNETFIAFVADPDEDASVPPWNHWYHCTAHTYGSWLRGDPRGWRARHHREHVDGDYRAPSPSGRCAALFERSQSLMRRSPVRIGRELRQLVVDAVAARLTERHVETRIVSLDSTHLHALIRCPAHDPRIVLGIAKQYATAQLKARGSVTGLNLARGDGLRAKGSHASPIQSLRHLENATAYIRGHISHGAVIREPDSIRDFVETTLAMYREDRDFDAIASNRSGGASA